MNVLMIVAVMNSTLAVVKIKPTKNLGLYGKFFGSLGHPVFLSAVLRSRGKLTEGVNHRYCLLLCNRFYLR